MRQVVTFVTVTLSTTVTTYNGSTDIPSDHCTYQVVATINDAIYAGTTTGTLIIQPSPMATAGLQASPLDGSVPLTVTFTNTSQGFGYTFLEIFDSKNRTFDDPETMQVTYDVPGTYEALLTIIGQGGTNQTRTTIVVHGRPALNQVIASPDESPVGEKADPRLKRSRSGYLSLVSRVIGFRTDYQHGNQRRTRLLFLRPRSPRRASSEYHPHQPLGSFDFATTRVNLGAGARTRRTANHPTNQRRHRLHTTSRRWCNRLAIQ